eukprot:5983100-Lingulodinium_polyedra.AAC.1
MAASRALRDAVVGCLEGFDVKRLLATLACGRAAGVPFPEELVLRARSAAAAALDPGGARPGTVPEEGQPFCLALLEAHLRAAGDPDW